MKIYKLTDMTRGWCCGNWDPSIIKTEKFEFGVKRMKAGEYDQKHQHLRTTEITIIVSGIVEINGTRYQADDIIVCEKGDIMDCRCIEDASLAIARDGSFKNDKWVIEEKKEIK